ncbi:TetR/AcrR family transcriptional regulator [Rhodococcus gordoniae]
MSKVMPVADEGSDRFQRGIRAEIGGAMYAERKGGEKPSVTTDGRSARAERTRQAVIEAHIALIRAGELKPTGAQIASRAGVSLRSLWGHFGDLETLFAATGAELMRRQDDAYEPIDPALPLDERIDAYCRQRAELLEYIAPFARSSEIRAPFSRELQRNRMRYLDRARYEIRALFADQLEGVDDAVRADIENLLGVSTTWPTWVSLRDVLRLSVPEAVEVMKRAVSALLMEASGAARQQTVARAAQEKAAMAVHRIAPQSRTAATMAPREQVVVPA